MGGSAKAFGVMPPGTVPGSQAVARPGDPTTPATVAGFLARAGAFWKRKGTAVPRQPLGGAMPPSIGVSAAKGVAAAKVSADRTRAAMAPGSSY